MSATVGGTKVKMVEAPVKEEDSGSEESEFMNYSGEFELPARDTWKDAESRRRDGHRLL